MLTTFTFNVNIVNIVSKFFHSSVPMKYFLPLSLLVCQLAANDLSRLLSDAQANLRVESARLMIDKSQAQIDEAHTAYFPTLKAKGLYQHKDKTTAFEPKTVYGIEVGAEITLFDGFRREALMRALRANKEGSLHTMEQERQNVLMETLSAYYDYLDTRDRLHVNAQKRKELNAEVARYEVLVKNDLATNDILSSLNASRLQAEYDDHALRTRLEQCRKDLELLSGTAVEEPIAYVELEVPKFAQIERHDLLSDRASIEILERTEERYTYLPSVSLAAKHKTMEYKEYDTMGGLNVQPANQNEIAASVSMTLFDMGRIAKEREQARLDTIKARKLLEYKTKKIQNDADISLLSLRSAREALSAATAEENARSEAFGTIKTRFEAGLLNSTAFLSELTSLTDARAKARHARNALQVAKANAAFAHGVDLMSLMEEKK